MIKIEETKLATNLAHLKTFDELMIQQLIWDETDMFINEKSRIYKEFVQKIFNKYFDFYYDFIYSLKEEVI